jgi:hypothetical protein
MARTKVMLAGLAAIGAAVAGYRQRSRGGGTPGASAQIDPPQAAPNPAAAEPGGPAQPEGARAGAPHEQAPPQPSNFDASGPVANTATPLPAPDHHPRDAIDEDAEEQAAAAEAAAIGGPAPDYPGRALDDAADPAFAPLAEAGEGENEGYEVAEFDHRREAESFEGRSAAERSIDETIDAQANPTTGERPEALAPPREPGDDPDRRPDDPGDDWQTWSGRAAGS